MMNFGTKASIVLVSFVFFHVTEGFQKPERQQVGFHKPEDTQMPPFFKEDNPEPRMPFPDIAFETEEPGEITLPSPFMTEEGVGQITVEPPSPEIRPDYQTDISKASKLQKKPPETLVHGTSVQTWTFVPSHNVERLQVDLTTPGRPLDARIELWQGPDNIPQKMRVYSENGHECPFSTLIETPVGYNTLAVRNTANMEFPLGATVVDADTVRPNYSNPLHSSRVTEAHSTHKRVQGNSQQTFKYGPDVVSLQIVLKTDGFPMAARVELSQGPSNNKQIVDIYCQDGLTYPVSLVIETPGPGKTLRIFNTASVEYPLKAWVEPCTASSKNEFELVEDQNQYSLPQHDNESMMPFWGKTDQRLSSGGLHP